VLTFWRILLLSSSELALKVKAVGATKVYQNECVSVSCDLTTGVCFVSS